MRRIALLATLTVLALAAAPLAQTSTWRPVVLSDTGMIGASWGVEWCVVGLDRNWAYNPRCKMARP